MINLELNENEKRILDYINKNKRIHFNDLLTLGNYPVNESLTILKRLNLIEVKNNYFTLNQELDIIKELYPQPLTFLEDIVDVTIIFCPIKKTFEIKYSLKGDDLYTEDDEDPQIYFEDQYSKDTIIKFNEAVRAFVKAFRKKRNAKKLSN